MRFPQYLQRMRQFLNPGRRAQQPQRFQRRSLHLRLEVLEDRCLLDLTPVTSFGAKGDGVTDDTAAILKAVAALPASDAVLYFPPGVYITSGPIYVANRNNFGLRGSAATIRISAATPYKIDLAEPLGYPPYFPYESLSVIREFSVLEIMNCSDWYVQGLRLDGNYKNRGPSTLEHSYGIEASGCHRFTIQSVEAQYCQGDGIVLEAMFNPLFPGARTPASNCSDFALLDITAHNLARNSVSLVGAKNGIIHNLRDHDIGTDLANSAPFGPWRGIGLEVDGGEENYEVVEQITATNLSMRNHRPDNDQANGGAIDVSRYVHYCTFSDFRYEQETTNTQSSQSIIIVGPTCDHITISDGKILVPNAKPVMDHFSYGIFLQGGNPLAHTHDVTIKGVTVDGPTIGIAVYTGCKDILIENNIVENTYRNSLWLLGECTVTRNLLLNVTGGGTGITTSFIQVQNSDPITCDYNILAYTLTSGTPPDYYFQLSVGVTNFSANCNLCYGLPGGVSANIGIEQAVSFMGNKFLPP